MILLIAALLAQLTHPCMDDAHKLCAEVKPGGGRVAACLKQHKDQLSQACTRQIAHFREEAHSCEADVQRLCPDTKPGPERHQCMMQHKDQVSPECREFAAQMMEHRQEGHEAMRACAPDGHKFCANVKPGDGRIIECLKQHQAELQPACARVLH